MRAFLLAFLLAACHTTTTSTMPGPRPAPGAARCRAALPVMGTPSSIEIENLSGAHPDGQADNGSRSADQQRPRQPEASC